eukprot:CAMPEP_0185566686 /NCGR_PEP_ID=MMETSP0434-20130131/62_1 /TAXON_ID=626734 ORGANISM="Favella taraikaensis, Strain Fe Narragansett Bay" /NCGR_SAMPLE_ID=MMETSP0434 /ASSEMBLY_ACC=CAM_ASM_000379 /LENGTH=75 /DNA_ID=CAMNT_0028180649 /DNA_START=27 /DNA_END=251 /DNA_ORIENTATION=-
MKSFVAALAIAGVQASSYYYPSQSHSSVNTPTSYDPWATPASSPAANIPAGWYNQNTQFTPIRIPYHPGTSKMTE